MGINRPTLVWVPWRSCTDERHIGYWEFGWITMFVLDILNNSLCLLTGLLFLFLELSFASSNWGCFRIRRVASLHRIRVICEADGPGEGGCVGGAAISWIGVSIISVRSVMFLNASSCFGFLLRIPILRTLATLLVVEMQDRPEEITLTSSKRFLEHIISLLPKSCLIRSFLWFWIFCSNVLSLIFIGLLSAYWAHPFSLSFLVPIFAISELRTLTSVFFSSYITLIVWLIFPTVLLGDKTS